MNHFFRFPFLLSMAAIGSVGLGASAQASATASLLQHYYGIKNALVSGDAVAAAQSAASFQAALINAAVNAAEAKAIQELKPALQEAANTIQNSKDLGKQREAFAKLSASMITLVKANKSSDKVYIDYCPMKKASWLSAEQAIKNPYYGSSMLTCGKVTETIQ